MSLRLVPLIVAPAVPVIYSIIQNMKDKLGKAED